MFDSTKTGRLQIYISQPLVQKFHDTLAFVLRVQHKVNFIRNNLREQLIEGGLGVNQGAVMLAAKDRLSQIEEFRQELRDVLDVVVEKVVLISN